MRSVPSDAVFEAHGLFNVHLDVPAIRPSPVSALAVPSSDAFATTEWIAGTATLDATDRYPLLSPSETTSSPMPVRFSFCPAFDPNSMAKFRRQSQLLALGTIPSAPGPSTTRFGRVNKVLAWWEDDHGLWSVVDEDQTEGINLVERWSRIMQDDEMKDVVDDGEHLPDHIERRAEMTRQQRDTVYGRICDLLLKVVECLRALHNRHLSSISCRPVAFSMSGAAPNDIVILNRFESVLPLGSLNTLSQLKNSPLASSGLFQHDPLDSCEFYLDEHTLRKNLRYLAPEIAIQKRVSPTGDIYSFGVLAYEMLTGTTIDGGPDSPEECDVDVLIDFHRHITMQILPPLDWLEREASLAAMHPVMPPRQLSDIIMRCLGKESDVRYSSLDSLAYDLAKLGKICRNHGDLAKFSVGEVDDLARFSLPARIIHRDAQLDTLHTALDYVRRRGDVEGPHVVTRVVNVSGVSGNGKTRIVRQFAQDIESSSSPPVVAWAKLEEATRPPLASFIQIFTALLDRSLADPNEDVREWNEKIRQTLGGRFPLFVSLIPNEYWRMLGVTSPKPVEPEVNWSTLRETFSSWCRQFLQLFATEERPLVIILDDLQWLPDDEAQYWRTMIDGHQPINHVLFVSTCRIQPGRAASSISHTTTNIDVPPLTEEGVLALIRACFHDRIASGHALASFLHAETGGLSLYVRTVISTLVREGVITFDYDMLIWQFDAVQVQKHLSKAGIDGYLEKLIVSLPSTAQKILYYVSALPPRGATTRDLHELLDVAEDEIEEGIAKCASTAGLLTRQGNRVRFAHDGPKAVAYRLIPAERAANIHSAISRFLRQPRFNKDFIFDAADHALIAMEMGLRSESNESFVDLLLAATSRSALATSFDKAAKFLDAAEAAIDASGGIKRWIQDQTSMTMRFLQFHAEIAAVSQDFERCSAKIKEVEPYLNTTYDKVNLALLTIRMLIAAGRLPEAVDSVFKTFAANGYDLDTAVDRTKLPRTAADVEALGAKLSAPADDEGDVRMLIVTILAVAGASIFFCEPTKAEATFALGLQLSLVDMRLLHENTALFLVTHALFVRHDIPKKKALIMLAKSIVQQCPMMYVTGHALTGVAVESFYWCKWTDLEEVHYTAIEGNISNANYEQATHALAFDLITRVFCNKEIPMDRVMREYDLIRPHVDASRKYMIELPLQYVDRIQKMAPGGVPWTFEGAIVTKGETESIQQQGLGLHTAMRHCLALRLAVFYDAPMEELRSIAEAGRPSVGDMVGVIPGIEWSFLVGLVAIRSGGHQDDIDVAMRELGVSEMSPDFVHRLLVLKVLQRLQSSANDSLPMAEDALDTLIEHGQHALAGLLAFYISQAIIKVSNSQRLATGFLRAAATSYRHARMFGVCEMLRERWPAVCPLPPACGILPSQVLGPKDGAPPPLRRASISTSNETVTSMPSSGMSTAEKDRMADKKAPNDQLDALALMRSSLALASEQDPPILLCTLLRILCQFLRAEYAAIALCDDSDESQVRLRAAGPFSRIVPYDVPIDDDTARQACPTSLILHSARTGRAITSLSAVSRFRSDPFYRSRLPRSVICLPILLQGKQKGVVLLSSSTLATTQSQWESAKEVVSTLATFATIITSNVSFTKRLKNEVDQRTKELTNALAAKTQFLSQCSHELRSPLSAVLGLAAVLEASSGLSDVQREHLRTIISSGEDLLGLINNILDHSRLESGSVTLESIPFTLREVVEGALDSVAAVAQKKNLEICLISAYDTDPPGLIGDPFRIKQILLNLLSNAVKFTAKGRVTVKWRWEEVPDQGVFLELDVEDTGIGIPAQKMDKLFRSFSQIDESITRSFGGSGLGLIISKDLARLLGGDCTATSEYGSGSKFTFSLQAKRNPAYEQDLRKLEKPRSCFIICPPGPWWNMLEENLQILNCRPVRFADDVHECLVKGHPDGLNSEKQFNFVMLDTGMVNNDILKQMKRLQPDARMLYLVRSIDLAKTIRDLNITRETIISRPIKFTSLVRAMLPNPDTMDSPMLDKTEKRSKKVNKKLSLEKPLAILLVDDNAVNVTVGKRILELFGYKSVVSAGDGQQAIEAAEKREYDLILLDLQMPVLDGFTAQKRIKASPLAGEPCIVALTANADKKTRESCEEAGFFDYLSKPLDIPRLEEILNNVYDWREARRLTGASAEKPAEEGEDPVENVKVGKKFDRDVGKGLKDGDMEIKEVKVGKEVQSRPGDLGWKDGDGSGEEGSEKDGEGKMKGEVLKGKGQGGDASNGRTGKIVDESKAQEKEIGEDEGAVRGKQPDKPQKDAKRAKESARQGMEDVGMGKNPAGKSGKRSGHGSDGGK